MARIIACVPARSCPASTPPCGLCLLIAYSVAGMHVGEALKDTMIMLVPMLMVPALVIVWPQVSLFLPSLISPEFLR